MSLAQNKKNLRTVRLDEIFVRFKIREVELEGQSTAQFFFCKQTALDLSRVRVNKETFFSFSRALTWITHFSAVRMTSALYLEHYLDGRN